MAGLGNTIYETEQQEILRKKDFEALRVMHELEAKFKKERKIIKIKNCMIAHAVFFLFPHSSV